MIRNRCDRGSATAEFAVVLPAVMAMVMLLLGLTRAITVSLDCQEAARAIARSTVAAQSVEDYGSVAHAIAGESDVTVHELPDRWEVRVACPLMPGPLGVLPLRVEGEAIGFKQGV
ncbi:TadE/TadG family type IV pilus assembly protein [Bifidobacterium avesanii]|uniref:Pilus assembly protein n=1 Tax=Bifidobacterium avesanii TaxID=1798157 RepID=A0A7K3TF87_9BIFI|nr:TadE family protein [Bifidobacterium avesanii]KAB8294401.1 TadE-like protein [Bifidobacterium avesanii]NEG77765.1 pilus assembly protein [Bifidobacterium avesanii]